MSSDEPKEREPFPQAELYLLLLSTIVAAPLAKSGWDALMASDLLRGTLALVAGAAALTIGFSFKYWETHLAEPTRRIIREIVSNKLLFAAAILALLGYGFVVIPDIARRVSPTSELEITELRSRLKLADQRIASLEFQLEDARKQVERLGGEPKLDPGTDFNKVWLELADLQRMVITYSSIKEDAKSVASEASWRQTDPRSLIDTVVKIRDRSLAADTRLTQIYVYLKSATNSDIHPALRVFVINW